MKSQRVRISLCVVVRDDGEWIAQPILATRSIVNEVIVIDAGTNAETSHLATKLGAKVFSFDWQGDYAAANNYAIDKASCDWILFLHPDEVLDQDTCDHITQWIKKPTHELASFVVTSYTADTHLMNWKPNRLSYRESEGFAGYVECRSIRLFKKSPQIFFTGKVNETVVVKLSPANPCPLQARIHHYGLGRPEHQRRQRELNYRVAMKKVTDTPNDVKALYEFAAALWEMNQLREAREYFHRVIDLVAEHIPSLVALGELYALSREDAKAIQYYRRVLELEPTNISALLGLSEMLIRLHHFQEAGMFLERALDYDAEHPEVLKKLGMLYFDVGHPGLARSLIIKASKVLKDDAILFLNLGKIELHLNHMDAARVAFKHGLELIRDVQAFIPTIKSLYSDINQSVPRDIMEAYS